MKYDRKIIWPIVIVALIIMLFVVFASLAYAPRYNAFNFNNIKSAQESNDQKEVIKAPTSTTIIFGGDVMLSRVVGQKMVKYNDFTWPFKKISTVMEGADLTVINLESPFTYGANHLVQTGSFSFNADPKTVAGLQLAGIDLVSLANNHFGNQGVKGMKDSFKILTDAGIGYVGAGENLAQAHNFKKFEINNLNFCFLAYAYPDDMYIAGSASAGMANMDINLMKNDVAAAKSDCDKVIVIMHAGIEYVNKPNTQQKNFAHVAIDSGADIVVGHHPHWVQIIETYKGKPILYSLGNLVFDQMWSRETAQGALAKAYFEGSELKKIEIIPIEIRDYGQAVVASSSTSSEILKRMELKSATIDF